MELMANELWLELHLTCLTCLAPLGKNCFQLKFDWLRQRRKYPTKESENRIKTYIFLVLLSPSVLFCTYWIKQYWLTTNFVWFLKKKFEDTFHDFCPFHLRILQFVRVKVYVQIQKHGNVILTVLTSAINMIVNSLHKGNFDNKL